MQPTLDGGTGLEVTAFHEDCNWNMRSWDGMKRPDTNREPSGKREPGGRGELLIQFHKLEEHWRSGQFDIGILPDYLVMWKK